MTIEDPHYTEAELRQMGMVAGSVAASSVLVLNTAHQEFARPDFQAWRKAGVEVLLDGRNLWNQTEAESAGLLYFGIGRSSRNERH